MNVLDAAQRILVSPTIAEIAGLVPETSTTLVTGGALRDILLGRARWPDARQRVFHGSEAWPFSQTGRPIGAPPTPAPVDATLAGEHLLVVGCGSVGSEVLRLIGGATKRLTLLEKQLTATRNPYAARAELSEEEKAIRRDSNEGAHERMLRTELLVKRARAEVAEAEKALAAARKGV